MKQQIHCIFERTCPDNISELTKNISFASAIVFRRWRNDYPCSGGWQVVQDGFQKLFGYSINICSCSSSIRSSGYLKTGAHKGNKLFLTQTYAITVVWTWFPAFFNLSSRLPIPASFKAIDTFIE